MNAPAPSFESCYHEYYQKVYRLAYGMTGNAHDAEEVTQEAFCRAFRSYDAFRGESSFFTWIYRITLNTAAQTLKIRKKLPIYVLTEDLGYTMDEIIDPNPGHDPETELLSKELMVRCLHCLTECMPLLQRKVFCLAVTIGLPLRLIAEILECSLSCVKTTLYRAKKRWQGYMEDRCSFIKQNNPCHCSQWVRFGLKNGWIQKDQIQPRPDIQVNLHSSKDIMELRKLRQLYHQLYESKPDEVLVNRIKAGIQNKEWSVLS